VREETSTAARVTLTSPEGSLQKIPEDYPEILTLAYHCQMNCTTTILNSIAMYTENGKYTLQYLTT
jgi:hypothetical protein